MMRLIVLAVLLCGPAMAQSHHHPPEHAALHEQFYQGWMRPDQPHISCCSLKDCAPVSKVRQVSGRWQALRDSDQTWLTIPPEKIEWNRDSPDGRSHLCSAGPRVFCFILGSGG